MRKVISRKNFVSRESLHKTKRNKPTENTLHKAALTKVKLIGLPELNVSFEGKKID